MPRFSEYRFSEWPGLDRRLSPAILIIMPKRDNDAPSSSEGWEGRFYGSLVFHLTFEIQHARVALGITPDLLPRLSEISIASFKTPRTREARGSSDAAQRRRIGGRGA
jgi:hypothetical protein